MFHDTRYEDIFAVAYSVDLKLYTHKVFIDEDRIFYFLTEYDLHVLLDIVIIPRDDHVLTAEYV